MFTQGFKLFFGFAIVAAIGATLFGLISGDTTGPNYFGFLDRDQAQGVISLGWKGTIGEPVGYIVLLFFAASAALIGISLAAFRDADPESVGELGETNEIPLAARPTAPSYWPLVAALGMGVLITGLVADNAAYWIIGIVLVAVVGFEWMMSAWADRATGDPEVNRALRQRVMAPIETPILAIASAAVVALAASRLFLAVSEFSAIWVAAALSIIVMAIAILFITRPNLGRGVLGGVLAAAAIGIIAAGIISAAVGIRDIEHHHGEEEHSEVEGEALGVDE